MIDREHTELALGRDTSALDDRERATLALADALMTQPGALDDAVVAELHRHYTPEQLVELTLKVMKFNVQKVMVALGTDTAVTAETVGELSWNQDGSFVAAD